MSLENGRRYFTADEKDTKESFASAASLGNVGGLNMKQNDLKSTVFSFAQAVLEHKCAEIGCEEVNWPSDGSLRIDGIRADSKDDLFALLDSMAEGKRDIWFADHPEVNHISRYIPWLLEYGFREHKSSSDPYSVFLYYGVNPWES